MGVIRAFDSLNRSVTEDDWIFLSSDGEEATHRHALSEDEHAPINLRKPRTSGRPKAGPKPEPTFRALGVRGKGQKKMRRYDNANQIMGINLINESENLDTVSITDFVAPKRSPFSVLLQNYDYDEFLNFDDERDLAIEQRCTMTEEIELEEVNNVGDSGSAHFGRIQASLRRELMRKHFPMGILSSIEEDLVEFFQENPQALYHTHLPGSYHRLLLHACCQYLNLNCQSIDSKGKRVSMVKNRKPCFHRPMKLLSEYLQRCR